MFCNNCGKPIDDDRTICEQCEAAESSDTSEQIRENEEISDGVEEMNGEGISDPVDFAEEEQILDTPESSSEEVSSENFSLNTSGNVAPKKSSKGMIIGITAAAIAVVALLVAVFWEPIVGLFNVPMKFDTPQEHFSYVESQAMVALADDLAASYSSAVAAYDVEESAGELEMHILLGDQALSMISTYLFESTELDISWLSDIMLNVDATAGEELSQAVLTLGLGEDEIISADIIVDMTKYVMWMAIPELSNTYLEMDMNEFYETYYDYGIDESGIASDYYTQYMAALPSEQVIHQLVTKYLDIVLAKVTDVQSAEETLTVGEISQECTTLTATISEKTLIEICIAVLETAKEDEVIIGVISDMAEFSDEDPEQAKEAFIEEIDYAIEDMQSALDEADAENYIEWIDYVDDRNNVIGRRIKSSGAEEEIYYLKTTDSDSFAFEANLVDSVEITGSGEEIRNIVNASYDVSVMGTQYIHLNVEDFDNNKLESGNLNGTIRLEPSEALYEELLGVDLGLDIALELIMESTKAQSHIELNAMLDNELFAGLTFDSKQTDATAVEAPAKAVDPMDEEQLMEWVKSFDFEQLVSNLEKTNIPNELVSAVEEYLELIAQSMDSY